MSTRHHRWFIILGLLLVVTAAQAQNESGRRPINKQRWQETKVWYDSSTATFEVRYPIIRSLPPVNSGMPWDILGTYIYMDSLARFDAYNQTAKALDRWMGEGTMNDTLRWMITYLYKVTDYNPIIFRQYADETELKMGNRYVASLNRLASGIKQGYRLAAPNKEDMRAIYAMLYSDYVLRVRVNRVDSMPLKNPGLFDTHIFRVTAEVVDTLKGHVFTTCNQQSTYKALDEGEEGPFVSTEGWNPCITFNYEHHNYPDPYGTPRGPFLYFARDQEFTMPADSGFTMKPGQEAIVFLSHHDALKDSTRDYYNLAVEVQGWNALPVLDGQVRDLNRAWVSTSQTMISYEEWKARFMALRDKILNGTY